MHGNGSENALQRNHTLATVIVRAASKALSAQTTGKTESDLTRLQAWCSDAEVSGIRVSATSERQITSLYGTPTCGNRRRISPHK